MSLEEYKKKRDFKKTPEPKGKKSKDSGKPIFVIQKHDATNLHYDFRIEVSGVLVSWAIPKGPSTDPSIKRLAMRTEDHPLDYADFEGVIPEDEYGGGVVMVWDKGTYKNLREKKKDENVSMKKSIDEGKVEVWLKGKKLQGGYNLIRTGKKGGKERWLFMKAKDDKADARKNPVSTEPKSAKTGRTLKQIKKANEKNSTKSS